MTLLAITFVTASTLEGLEPSDLAAALVFIGGPFAVGQFVRQRSQHAQEAVARADRLEREREAATRQAIADERTRIARELHDIVSHSISVVAIQTQAVRRRLQPDQECEATDLAAVEATARQALAEMRRLFGVLRADGESASLTPQPGLAELERLVARRRVGDLHGAPHRRGRAVPARPGRRPGGVPDRPGGPHQRPPPLRRGDGRGRRGLRPGHLEVGVADDGSGLDGARRNGDAVTGWSASASGSPSTTGRSTLGPRTGRRHPAGRRPPGPGTRHDDQLVIADDQGMVRAGFRSLLEAEPDLEVVGEAADGEAAVDVVTRLRPDVTLMDIRMPVLDGLAATRQLVEAGVPTRVLVLTTFDLDEYVFAALRAGASGFLLKDAPAEELAAAIRVVAAGDALLAPGVTRRVIDAFVRRAPPTVDPDRPVADLTRREVEVLGLLARGLSNADIAARLFVSEGTTKTHVSNVLTKLGLRDRVQAVIYAYENGVVVPGGRRRSVARLRANSVARPIRLRPPAARVEVKRSAPQPRSPHDHHDRRPPSRHGRLERDRHHPDPGPVRSARLPGRRPGPGRSVRRRGRVRRPGRRNLRRRDARHLRREPEPLQFKSLGFHWAYAFWFVPALLSPPMCGGGERGSPMSPPSSGSSGSAPCPAC